MQAAAGGFLQGCGAKQGLPGARRWFADTQFDAVLFCGDCRAPSPPPAPPAALAPAGAAASSAMVRVSVCV